MKSYAKFFLVVSAVAASAVFLTTADAQTIYDNTENFTGFSFSNGGATTANKVSLLVADDLTYNPLFALTPVTSFQFSLSNSNTTTQLLTPTVEFFDSNGTGGGPGTLLASFSFNAVSLASNNVTVLTATLTPLQYFTLPTDGTIWAGIFFTANGSETAAIVNKFGQGLFDPPTVGTSQDQLFRSSGQGPNASNPAGTVFASPFSANPAANFGWQLSTVPEPASILLFSLGGLGTLFVARKRRRSA